MLEKSLASLLGCKEIKPVNPKGNQSWIFIGRTDDEAETPILWTPDVKNWLIGKDPPTGKDWEQEKKGMTEDEMVGWHHRVNGHECEWAPGDGDGQEAWYAAVRGVARVRHSLSTKQEQTGKSVNNPLLRSIKNGRSGSVPPDLWHYCCGYISLHLRIYKFFPYLHWFSTWVLFFCLKQSVLSEGVEIQRGDSFNWHGLARCQPSVPPGYFSCGISYR